MFRAPQFAVNLVGHRWLTIDQAVRAVGWWLAPARCALCDAPVPRAQVDLCPYCQRRLPQQPQCWQAPPPGCDALLNPWAYAYPVDAMLKALKFGGERCYARILGTLLAEARRAAPAALPGLVVPVPLHRERLRQRGYNQAAELARYAAGVLRLPMGAQLLIRQRNTAAQTSLDNVQRRHNVRAAFRCHEALGATDIALVDDVMTTGSTLLAAAAALRAAGARRIELWVVARVARDQSTGIFSTPVFTSNPGE